MPPNRSSRNHSRFHHAADAGEATAVAGSAGRRFSLPLSVGLSTGSVEQPRFSNRLAISSTSGAATTRARSIGICPCRKIGPISTEVHRLFSGSRCPLPTERLFSRPAIGIVPAGPSPDPIDLFGITPAARRRRTCVHLPIRCKQCSPALKAFPKPDAPREFLTCLTR